VHELQQLHQLGQRGADLLRHRRPLALVPRVQLVPAHKPGVDVQMTVTATGRWPAAWCLIQDSCASSDCRRCVCSARQLPSVFGAPGEPCHTLTRRKTVHACRQGSTWHGRPPEVLGAPGGAAGVQHHAQVARPPRRLQQRQQHAQEAWATPQQQGSGAALRAHMGGAATRC
jgi:hypothetical protein